MNSEQLYIMAGNIRDLDTKMKELSDMRKRWERELEKAMTARGITKVRTTDNKWEATREARIRIKPLLN